MLFFFFLHSFHLPSKHSAGHWQPAAQQVRLCLGLHLGSVVLGMTASLS